jgi:hypothetical protein
MGLKSQFQMRMKQRLKRKKKRKRLTAKGLKVDDFLYGRYYLKSGQGESKGT